MKFSQQFLQEVKEVVDKLQTKSIEKVVDELVVVRERGGRLFILGVGGSAANASHAVNDFRKICKIECYAPTDNVSELTARTNDDGWASIFSEWLKGSRLKAKDGLLIFSVGGGNLEKNISPNLVSAIKMTEEIGASIIGIVGRDGGYTAKVAKAHIIVPTVNPDHITPLSEAFQAVLWHLIVSHPKLTASKTKWESVKDENKKENIATKKYQAIFLDRDGVINKTIIKDGMSYPPKDISKFKLLSGVKQACNMLKKAGYKLVIVTNQPDVGRGTITQNTVEKIHSYVLKQLPIDKIEVCYHSGNEQPKCDCRKPQPGMLKRATQAMGIDLSKSWMIGDRMTDIECGHSAGCKTILIGDGYNQPIKVKPDFKSQSLLEAVKIILK